MMRIDARWAACTVVLAALSWGCSSGNGSSSSSAAAAASATGSSGTTASHGSSSSGSPTGSSGTHSTASSTGNPTTAATVSSSSGTAASTASTAAASSSGASTGASSSSGTSGASSGSSGSGAGSTSSSSGSNFTLPYNVAVLWPGGTAIWNLTTSSQTQTASFEVGGVTGLPAWSADGTEIAFNEHQGDDSAYYFGKVAVYDVGTSGLLHVFIAADPSWSPISGTENFVADLGGTSTGLEMITVASDDAGFEGISPAPTQPAYDPADSTFTYLDDGSVWIDQTLLLGGFGNQDELSASGVTSYSWFGNVASEGIVYIAPGASNCDLTAVPVSSANFGNTTAVVTGVGCTSTYAVRPNDSVMAVGDGTNLYVTDIGGAGGTFNTSAESSLTAYTTATSAISEVQWTADGQYLAYATLTPDTSNPDQGQITVTFLPYTPGAGADTADARSFTTVGQTFQIAPVTLAP